MKMVFGLLLLGVCCSAQSPPVPKPPTPPISFTEENFIMSDIDPTDNFPRKVQVSWQYAWPAYSFDLLSGTNLKSFSLITNTAGTSVVVLASSPLRFYRVTAHPATNAVTRVEWDSLFNTHHYNLYFGPTNRTYTNVVSVTNSTFCVLSNLPYSGEFAFALTAVFMGLESDYSPDYFYKTPVWDTNVVDALRMSVKNVP